MFCHCLISWFNAFEGHVTCNFYFQNVFMKHIDTLYHTALTILCFERMNSITNLRHHNETRTNIVSYVLSLIVTLRVGELFICSYFMFHQFKDFHLSMEIFHLSGHCLVPSCPDKRGCTVSGFDFTRRNWKHWYILQYQ